MWEEVVCGLYLKIVSSEEGAYLINDRELHGSGTVEIGMRIGLGVNIATADHH